MDIIKCKEANPNQVCTYICELPTLKGSGVLRVDICDKIGLKDEQVIKSKYLDFRRGWTTGAPYHTPEEVKKAWENALENNKISIRADGYAPLIRRFNLKAPSN